MAKLKKRADGRFVKTMTDPKTKKRIFFYGASEREINRKIMEFTGRAVSGRTFGEVADDWWEQTERTLSPNSIHTYDVALRRAEEAFGSTPIKDITAHDLHLFITRFAGIGAASLARKTVSNQLTVINQVFKYAICTGDVELNPAQSVTLPKHLKASKRTAATQSDEEIIKRTADVWLFPFLILYTGLRRGEALALTGADIDREERMIYVTKSVAFASNRPIIKDPKTEAGTRTVPILDPLLPHIPDLAHDEYLFPSAEDPKKPMSHGRFFHLLTKYKEETGANFVPHQLRHSYATILFECGIDAKTAQHLLGHSQISTTMDIYTDFRKKAEAEAIAKLNAALAQK